MIHKEFLLHWVSEVCEVERIGVPVNRQTGHLPRSSIAPTEPQSGAGDARIVLAKRCTTPLPGNVRPVTFPFV